VPQPGPGVDEKILPFSSFPSMQTLRGPINQAAPQYRCSLSGIRDLLLVASPADAYQIPGRHKYR